MFAKITHEELIERAARWLRGTMRARVVLCEKWARNSEMPDAIGWTRCGSHVVECKCSLADFHADKRKTPRLCAGLGNFRWYMTPPGLLASVKLPACWGWLEVYPKQVRRRVRAREVPHGWWHHQAEMDMLAKWAMIWHTGTD